VLKRLETPARHPEGLKGKRSDSSSFGTYIYQDGTHHLQMLEKPKVPCNMTVVSRFPYKALGQNQKYLEFFVDSVG